MQIELFADASETVAEWKNATDLRVEMDSFAERLVERLGLAETTAGERSRHFAAMVRQSRVETISEFVRRPELVVAAVRAPIREGTRRARHLAALDYLDLFQAEAPRGTSEAVRAALEGFPGRVSPAPHLVDLALGGSKKQVRARVPLSWDDGDRLIKAAGQSGATAGTAMRDAALVAFHVRSGLPPRLVRGLRWEGLVPLLSTSNDFERLPWASESEFVVHTTALGAARGLFRAEGEPSSGAVFRAARRPFAPLSESAVAGIIEKAATVAGFPALDRRHLRAPFGLWLAHRGWDELRVSRAFGYGRVREFRALVRPLEEAQAQIQTRELLVIREAPSGGDSGKGEVTLRHGIEPQDYPSFLRCRL